MQVLSMRAVQPVSKLSGQHECKGFLGEFVLGARFQVLSIEARTQAL